jgi:SynChlorMet cassette radical SAM/SPASM protein ScmF
LHPDFKTLLEVIRGEDLDLEIETNGLLCSREIAREVAKSGNAFISVSLDSVQPEVHDWIRGVPGSFESAVRAVRTLVGEGVRPQIIMSLMRGNADQVEEMIRMAEGLGAGSLKFNVVMPVSRGKGLRDSGGTLEIEEIIGIGRQVEMDLARGSGIEIYFDYPAAFRPLSRLGEGNGCDTCGILGILGVLPDGQYALCGIGKHVPELTFGVIGIDSLEQIWYENPILGALRGGLPELLEGVCRKCLMRRHCLGACVAQNYYRTGSLWAPFWFCEEAYQEGLFPESRLSVIH